VGSFPALPSPYNPFVASAAEAARGAGSIYNQRQTQIAEAQRQAAALDERKRQQEAVRQHEGLQTALEMFNRGAMPEFRGQGQAGSDRPTLQRQEPNPDIPENGQGNWVTDPYSGGRFYMPSEGEREGQKESAKRQAEVKATGFVPQGKLREMIAMTGRDPDQPITPTESHTLMQSLNIAQPQQGAMHIDTTGDFQDAQGNPVPVMIDPKTGKTRVIDLSGLQGGSPGGAFDPSQQQQGGQGQLSFVNGIPQIVPPSQAGAAQGGAGTQMGGGAPGGPFTFQPKARTTGEGPNKWAETIADERSSPEDKARARRALDISREPRTEADKDRDAARTALAADRAERRGERAEDRAEKQKKTYDGIKAAKAKAIAKANSDYRKAHKAAQTPEEEQDALDNYRSDVDDAQSEYETSITGESGNNIPHNDWANSIQGAPSKFPQQAAPADKKDKKGAAKKNPFREAVSGAKANPFR
jgi:hypothetical protein